MPTAIRRATTTRAPASETGAAPLMGAHHPKARRIRLGGFEVTALLAGTSPKDDPHAIFGKNVDAATFEKVAHAHHLPTDWSQFFFTPTLVHTGHELILFDTGLNASGLTEALAEAGYRPDQIDTVVLTHMHGDHIGGLMTDGAPTFPKARHIAGSVEHNAWAQSDSESFAAYVAPLSEKFDFIDDGAAVAPGVTTMMAPGHTTGHMTFMLESDGRQLLLFADVANHFAFSLANPDWEVGFDTDSTQAAQTRRRVLDMLATDRIPFLGYHMPFPAMGYADRNGDGFRYIPESYQLMG